MLSSARYKHDIHDMGAASSKLTKLRPVSFRYNNDPTGALQYGLVAEEVAKVYPELVAYGPDGEVMTVRYVQLSALLLNELQKRTAESQRQARQLTRQGQQLATLSGQMAAQRASFEQRLSALEHTLAKDHAPKLAAAFGR